MTSTPDLRWTADFGHAAIGILVPRPCPMEQAMTAQSPIRQLSLERIFVFFATVIYSSGFIIGQHKNSNGGRTNQRDRGAAAYPSQYWYVISELKT